MAHKGKKRTRKKTDKWGKKRIKGFRHPELYTTSSTGQILLKSKKYKEIRPGVMKEEKAPRIQEPIQTKNVEPEVKENAEA